MENITVTEERLPLIDKTDFINSTSRPDLPTFAYPFPVVVFTYTLMTLTAIITFLGNAMVILAFRHYYKLRTSSNYFIVSLACIDILGGCVLLPLYVDESLRGHWSYGSIPCYVWLVLDWCFYVITLSATLLITVDRFLSVRFPIWYKLLRKKKITLVVIFLKWTVPVCTFTGLHLSVDKVTNKAVCDVCFTGSHLQNTIVEISYFWLTLLFMCWIYVYMFCFVVQSSRKAMKKEAKMRELSRVISRRQGLIDGDRYRAGSKHETSYSIHLRKSFRTFSLVLGVFIISWVPQHVILIMEKFVALDSPGFEIAFRITYALIYMNCPINPSIYAFVSPKYQYAIRKILRSLKGRLPFSSEL